MAFSFDPANVATSTLDGARSLLGDIEAAAFLLHDEEVDAQFSSFPARAALVNLARMMRTRLGMRATAAAAGPFRREYRDRIIALDALISDLLSMPLPSPFGGESSPGPMGVAVGDLVTPDMSLYKTD